MERMNGNASYQTRAWSQGDSVGSQHAPTAWGGQPATHQSPQPPPNQYAPNQYAPNQYAPAQAGGRSVQPTGREVFFGADEIIVSKTNTHGKITYANSVFLRVSSYEEQEVIGQPHSFIRHPDMPRVVFKLLWDAIQGGREIFAYVDNLTKFGDHYWVFAHVTPTLNESGTITGFHSMRRCPKRDKVERVRALYGQLLAEERRHASKVDAIAASSAFLQRLLDEKGLGYEEFIFSI